MYNLKIENFQRLKSVNMELDGFVVIEGQSNLGKSSIRRAIGVATQNLWEANFVSKGSKNTTINFEAEDIQIQCTKGTSNEFIILKDGKRAEYKKAGKDIPKEIVASGFSPLVIGKEKINLLMAKQYDPLFMVSYSDQQNTKILNAVFDVDIIEKANELVIKDIVSQKRELKRELQVSHDKIKELDETEILLRKMRELKVIYEKIELIDNYSSHLEELEDVEDRLSSSNIIFDKLERLLAIDESYKQATELQNKLKEYQSLDEELKSLTSQLKLVTINDKLLMLRDLDNVIKESSDNVDEYLFVQEDLGKIEKAEKIYNQLKLIILYKKRHYDLHLVDKKLNNLSKVNMLMKQFPTLQLLDKLPFVKWQIEGKNKEQDAVSKGIALCDKEIKEIGLCPCCGNDLH